MRVVFMGSAPIAVPTLVYLHERHELVAVVSQPDKPKGRKRELTPTAVKAEALRRGLEVLEPRKLRAPEFLDRLRGLSPEVIVVMAYGRLVPPEVLSMPPHGCVNIHGSLLPDHRGPCPIERAILQGDRLSGITTFYMNEGFDTGDVILTRELPIAPDDSGGSLREKMSLLAVDAIDETLRRLGDGSAPRVPQDLEAGSHAAIITREEARIDWTEPADAIDRRVRACDPEPGAYATFKGQPLKVRRVRPLADGDPAARPGTVLGADRERGLQVAAGEATAIVLEEVQPAGKRWMSGVDFLAGYRPPVGEPLDPILVESEKK
jgi:methionyl-tRNA formyltransferase